MSKKQSFFKFKTDYFFIISLVVMLILFISSSQTYKQQTSVPFLAKYLNSQPLKEWLSQFSFTYGGSLYSVAHSGYYKFVEFFIRKGAHFGTYFLLGGSLYLGLQPRLKLNFLSIYFAWFSATGYAGLDEFHQQLTGGRTPLFQDVALDSIGALCACFIFALYYLWRKKKH